MPPRLPSGTMATPRLPGTVSLPRCHLPFPPIFSLAVVLCPHAGAEVEAVVKDAEGKLAIAGGECKQVLVVYILR